MAWAVALLIAAPALAIPADEGVDLGGAFGKAVARATPLSPDTIQLELEVEADEDAALVAHLIDPGGTQETIPLSSRGTGLFGIRTEVRKTDYLVVFEALEGSRASQSQPLRLKRDRSAAGKRVIDWRQFAIATLSNFSPCPLQHLFIG